MQPFKNWFRRKSQGVPFNLACLWDVFISYLSHYHQKQRVWNALNSPLVWHYQFLIGWNFFHLVYAERAIPLWKTSRTLIKINKSF